jgi:hypothetical protein
MMKLLYILIVALGIALAFTFSASAEQSWRCAAWDRSEICCYMRCKRARGGENRPYTKCELECVRRHDPNTWKQLRLWELVKNAPGR